MSTTIRNLMVTIISSDEEARQLEIFINGTRYRYNFSISGPPMSEHLDAIRKRLKHSHGQALSYIKQQSTGYERL
jgi:hypothetical protein